MLQRVVERLEQARELDEIIVATTENDADDRIVDFCRSQGWSYFRGSELDVLDRYWRTARHFAADSLVRVTSDCPLIDPSIVDETVRLGKSSPGCDYTCNFWPSRRFPRGLDVEWLTFDTLERVHCRARQLRHREHVTLSIYENPNQFRIGSLSCDGDYSDFRWTVDTEQDLQLIQKVCAYFGERRFDWRDIVRCFQQNPAWLQINEMVLQKAA